MTPANAPTPPKVDRSSAEEVLASRQAVDRLVLSRARLRLALQGGRHAPGSGRPGQGFGPAARPSASGWIGRLAGMPITRLVLDALAGRWRRHPWHAAAWVANDVARAMLQPVAQRHPWRLVTISAVAGGVLAFGRPWRWLPRPALLIGLAPQLLGQLLASPGVRGWLAGQRPGQTASVP